MLAVLLMVQVLVTGDADREVARFFVDTGQKRRAGLWLITDGVSGQVLVVDTVKVGWKSIAAVPCYSLPRRDSGLVVSERWQRYRLRSGWHCLVKDAPAGFEQKMPGRLKSGGMHAAI